MKNSKLLLAETKIFESKTNSNKYKTYKRGTIIKVDFGVNLGSEMAQVHFAIVLNNYDNTNNNVLTIVPLTSKPGKFNLNLDNLIEEICVNRIKQELLKIRYST